MPYTHRAFVTTLTISLVTMFMALVLSVVGAFYVSIHEAQQSRNELCAAFASLTRKPAPPIDTPLKQREQQNYEQLLIFNARYGCD